MSLELDSIDLEKLKLKINDLEDILERVQNFENLLDKIDEIEKRVARLEIRLNLPAIEKLKRKIKGEQMIKSIQMEKNNPTDDSIS